MIAHHNGTTSAALQSSFTRREFCTRAVAAAGGALAGMTQRSATAASGQGLALRLILGSCLYGYAPLDEILSEVQKTGAKAIDLWPMVHGNQREQAAEMGEEKLAALLAAHDVSLGCITQYPLGPFGLQDEMRFAGRLGCQTIVTGAKGPQGLKGSELKAAVVDFVQKMKPHLDIAAQTGVTVAIENHGHSLIESPDSLRWLAEQRPSPHLGIALAPYHLPQDESLLAGLIRDLGDAITVFYAWQHGAGCMSEQPKEQELLQMPGRGPLDFAPLLAALKDIDYRGWTEIFMHPFPRGIPILETTEQVTAEINRARHYLAEKSP